MVSTCDPHAFQNAARRAVAASSPPGRGVSRHQRCSNRAAKPASGPEYSVPAMGWPGTKWTWDGRWGAMAAITASLTEPTSVTIAPGARCGPICSATAPHAPTGTDTITRSAPLTASPASVV